jgi:hypothetical protein
LLCRLALGSTVNNIWCTINEIKHAGHPSTEEQILKKVSWKFELELKRKESSQGLGRIFYSAPYGTCLKFCFVDELLQVFVVWFSGLRIIFSSVRVCCRFYMWPVGDRVFVLRFCFVAYSVLRILFSPL